MSFEPKDDNGNGNSTQRPQEQTERPVSRPERPSERDNDYEERGDNDRGTVKK